MSLNLTYRKSLSISLSALFIAVPLSFVDAKSNDRRGPGGKPPQEALTVCSSQTEGAECSFTTSRGDLIEGSCKAPPHGEGALACVPVGGPPSRKNRQQ